MFALAAVGFFVLVRDLLGAGLGDRAGGDGGDRP